MWYGWFDNKTNNSSYIKTKILRQDDLCVVLDPLPAGKDCFAALVVSPSGIGCMIFDEDTMTLISV